MKLKSLIKLGSLLAQELVFRNDIKITKVYVSLNVDSGDMECTGARIMTRPILSNVLVFLFLIKLSCYSTFVAAEQLVFSSVNEAYFTVGQCSSIIKHAYSSLGHELRIDLYPAKRALIMADAGRNDGELCRVATLENYDNLIRIDPPLLMLTITAFVRKNWTNKLEIDSLSKYNLGVLRGVVYTEKLTRGMSRSVHNNLDTLFRLLSGNRLDIVLAMKGDGIRYIRKNGLEGSIMALELPLAEVPIHHYLHKKHINIVPQITEALRELYDSGKHRQIMIQGVVKK